MATAPRSRRWRPRMSTPEPGQEIEAIVARGGDADDILRDVVAALGARYRWAGIFFVEEADLVLGPASGTPDEARRTQVPVTYQGDRVAELAVDDPPAGEPLFLPRRA